MATRWQYILFSLFILLCWAGCGRNHIRQAEGLRQNRLYEESLEHYLKALKSDPDRIDVRIDIDRLLKEASTYYFQLGQDQEKMNKGEVAVLLYKKSLEFDPANNQAQQALRTLVGLGPTLKDFEAVKKEMEINVGLPAALKGTEPIDLQFKTKVSLMKIFEALSKSGEVNILFDSGFRDRKVSLSLSNMTFHEALARICQVTGCRYYILDRHNIIVTQDSTDSQRRYQQLLMKNLYFSRVDAAEAKQVIESVYRPEKLILNKGTNSLVVRDSLENLTLIEKLSQFIDKRKGEVEIEVEILEVDHKKLKEYGTELSAYQVGVEIGGFAEGKRLNDLYYVTADDIRLTMPRMLWKFFSSVTDSKILARPKVRGLDREKIEISLGEKRPIPRTTFVPMAAGGLDQQPITSYDLRDVGISLAITPEIYYNREVTLSLNFELTYVTDLGGAYVPPTLGNRKVSTKLRLRDGETGIIAGLMRGSSTGSRDGVPVLNAIPVVKEIFSSRSKVHERTDILLSITPRILRMPEITRSDLETYLVGTAARVELKKWRAYEDQNMNNQEQKR
jgi:general secretion pathway protein D